MKKLLILIIIIIIGIILFQHFGMKQTILKQAYPITYSEYVEKYAKQYNIDPLLIYSIIKAESNFNPNVKSKSNAYGLMQIMKDTAYEIADDAHIELKNTNMLYDPEINIRIGVAYFDFLLKKYNGNINISIIAYNAGFGNVDKWIMAGTINKDGQDLENVPFKETNNYARKILRDYEMYKDLY